MKIEKNSNTRRTSATCLLNQQKFSPAQISKIFTKGVTLKQAAVMIGNILQNNNSRSYLDVNPPTEEKKQLVEDVKWPNPDPNLLPIPNWFKVKRKEIDISVIVPLFRSRSVIEEQIKSWDYNYKGLKIEVIYIDDCCPDKSYEVIIPTWSKFKTKLNNRGVGKILLNRQNVGYGHACNAAAEFASGKYLVFLNADTRMTPNWLKPMIDRMESNPENGIVGNMHLKVIDGFLTVDSAGSEWVWSKMCFEHIGRHSYNGVSIMKPYNLAEATEYILTAGEREMVTGACFMIKRELFKSLNGYDINYRIGYWEDSDLSMRAKEMGYKVFYEPNSRIYHDVGHSKSGQHRFMMSNREYFFNKWVYNGKIDKYVRPRPTGVKPSLKKVFIKRTAANGDVIAAASIASAIKKENPDCEITFATVCNSVLLNNPWINHVEALNDSKSKKISKIVGFDATYDLDESYEINPKKHIIQAYADYAGVSCGDCNLFIHTEPSIYDLKLPQEYVVIHPGRTAWVGRHWISERFNELALILQQNGFFVVTIGTAEGTNELNNVDLNLIGETNIYQSANIIKNSLFFVGIDSLPMWLAQCFNKPGVCFFGSVDPKYRLVGQMQGIRADIPCIGCHHEQSIPCVATTTCKEGNLACEKEVTAEMLWEKIKNLI